MDLQTGTKIGRDGTGRLEFARPKIGAPLMRRIAGRVLRRQHTVDDGQDSTLLDSRGPLETVYPVSGARTKAQRL
jgi:hypothetical protein